jgi:methanogenic corrinoid protein MtbC1
MKKVMQALEEAGIRNQIKVMVGGAPVTKEYAESIGADAYGENATASVEVASKLIDS